MQESSNFKISRYSSLQRGPLVFFFDFIALLGRSACPPPKCRSALVLSGAPIFGLREAGLHPIELRRGLNITLGRRKNRSDGFADLLDAAAGRGVRGENLRDRSG